MLTKRRERMIAVEKAMREQQYHIEVSKRGAIAILAFFAGVGFLVGFIIEKVAL